MVDPAAGLLNVPGTAGGRPTSTGHASQAASSQIHATAWPGTHGPLPSGIEHRRRCTSPSGPLGRALRQPPPVGESAQALPLARMEPQA